MNHDSADHTPGPWEAVGADVVVAAGTGVPYVIAHCPGPDGELNAAYIVKRCNPHHEGHERD